MTALAMERAIIDELIAMLGVDLVIQASGLSNISGLDGWLDGSGGPSVKQMKRLQAAHSLLSAISEVRSPDLARHWFICNNVVVHSAKDSQLIAPWKALRNDEFEAVELSAIRLAAGISGY